MLIHNRQNKLVPRLKKLSAMTFLYANANRLLHKAGSLSVVYMPNIRLTMDHFSANCTTLPSHIENPFAIYILPYKIHKLAIYVHVALCSA